MEDHSRSHNTSSNTGTTKGNSISVSPSASASANTSTNLIAQQTHSTSQGPNSSTGTLNRKQRPLLRLRASDRGDKRRYIYSTDDDEQEWAADLEREYNEGYSDGLRSRRRRNDDLQRTTSAGMYLLPPAANSTIDSGTTSTNQANASSTAVNAINTLDRDRDVGRQRPTQQAEASGGPRPQGPKRIWSHQAGHVGSASPAGKRNISSDQQPDRFSDPPRGLALSQHHTNKEHDNSGKETPDWKLEDSREETTSQTGVKSSDNNSETQVVGNEEADMADDAQNSIGNSDKDTDEDEEEDVDDGASIASNETFTLRERQEAINTSHPFGIRIWKPAIYKKSRSVQKIAEGDIHSTPGKDVAWYVWLGNLFWTVLFGTLLLVVCTLASATCYLAFWSPSARQYGRVLFDVGRYLYFPFGHYVELSQDKNYLEEDEGEGRSISEYERWQAGDVEYGRLFFGPAQQRRDSSARNSTSGNIFRAEHNGNLSSTAARDAEEDVAVASDNDNDNDNGNNNYEYDDESDDDSSTREDSPLMNSRKRRYFGRGNWNVGRVLFYVWSWVVIFPMLYVISTICWLGVFSIPMARVTSTLVRHLKKHPLALSFRPASSYSRTRANQPTSIILCTYRALGWNYYKYTIDGTNIIIINLMVPVFFVVFDYYLLAEWLELGSALTSHETLFILSLLSVIPLAYFIGQAVASISAQSSMGMGAAINAFFSTVVEVFLYSVALNQGKGHLVEGSIVGSILAGILLLPGLSMCAGAIKRKTQRYNPRSAGVSSTMLVFAVVGAFAPTVFYQIYGPYELQCGQHALYTYQPPSPSASGRFSSTGEKCQLEQVPLEDGLFYRQVIRPLSLTCSIYLFVSYVIGLWFTLRTHAAMIWSIPTASETEGLLASTTHGVPVQSSDHRLIGAAGKANNGVTCASPSLNPTPQANQTGNSKRQNVTLLLQPPPHSSISPNPGRLNNSGSVSPSNLQATQRVVVQLPPNMPQNLARNQTQGHSIGLKHQGNVQPPAHTSSSGHDAPNWSRTKSTVILLGATLLYAIIAEILVDNVDVVLKNFSISPKLLGITVFALVPNTTEFLNAISFAINGNIALSMEIGSAYGLQVCLLQIPALVVYSMWKDSDIVGPINRFIFSLVFPRWDLWVVIFCVFLFSYIYAEGKSNYFKGSILILAYMVSITGFVLIDTMSTLES